MKFLSYAWDWLTVPAQWQGSSGIPIRILEQLWYTGLSLLIAALGSKLDGERPLLSALNEGNGSRGEKCQLVELASIQRQIYDRRVTDDLSLCRRSGVDLRYVRIDRDGLRRCRDRHLEVQCFALVDLKMNVRQFLGREALLADRDVVDARLQLGDRVVAAIVGYRLPAHRRWLDSSVPPVRPASLHRMSR